MRVFYVKIFFIYKKVYIFVMFLIVKFYIMEITRTIIRVFKENWQESPKAFITDFLFCIFIFGFAYCLIYLGAILDGNY